MNALRYVGGRGCRDQRYRQVLAQKENTTAVIDFVSGRPNVTLRAEVDGKPLALQTSPDVRDFRDVAVLTYIFDTLYSRRAAPDYWSRELHCIVPVRGQQLWKSVESLLCQLLRTLAGDQYSFEWLPIAALPAEPRHKAAIPGGFDAVCLFSGGIDSLLGAYKLMSEGKRLLLVGHQSEPATASAEKELFRQLKGIFPGQASLIQFRVSISMASKPRFRIAEHREDTHRVRSFLFLALAAAVADSAGVREIYMPENGLMALNPRLDFSRLGTSSTRTAHPKFLSEWRDLAARLGVFHGVLKNPFLYESKTDMLQSLDSRLVPLIRRAISCARPSRYQDKHVKHCGYCVPCIYRRVAMSGIQLDGASDYAFDVFTQLDTLTTTKRLDFIALASFARRFRLLTPLQKQSVVLSQGYFSPTVGDQLGPYAVDDYSPWVAMLDRWTEHFLKVVDQHASASTKQAIA